jgi:hypothetical protein
VRAALEPYLDRDIGWRLNEAEDEAREAVFEAWSEQTAELSEQLKDIGSEAEAIAKKYRKRLAALNDELQTESAPLKERLDSVRDALVEAWGEFVPALPERPQPQINPRTRAIGYSIRAANIWSRWRSTRLARTERPNKRESLFRRVSIIVCLLIAGCVALTLTVQFSFWSTAIASLHEQQKAAVDPRIDLSLGGETPLPAELNKGARTRTVNGIFWSTKERVFLAL